jgi:hypothetical protein
MKKITAIIFSSIFLLSVLIFLPTIIYAQPSGCIEHPTNIFELCPNHHPHGCTDDTNHYWCCINVDDCIPPQQPPAPSQTCPGGVDGVCRVSCEAGETPQGNCGFHMVCCVTQTPADQQQDGNGGTGGETIETAIGPIDPSNLQGFIQSLLGIAFGVAGGIAFLLMLFGSFQIMTSSGNPEKMKAGSELITSALTGLLFIIFSVFILKLIGVTILQIPGFGQ